MDERAEIIIRDVAKLSSQRSNFEGQWNEIAQRVIPNHSDSFFSNGSGRTQGDKRTQQMFDTTAGSALNKFAAILDSLLTPRNQTWHRLKASNPNVNKDRQAKLYFEEAARVLFKYRYAPKANFSSQNQHNYKSLGAYGTGCMFVDELSGPDPGIRYKNIHIGEVYILENHQGLVDKVYRKFPLSARQALQEFGPATPQRVLEVLKTDPEKQFWFIHAVIPNTDRDPFRLDYRGMEYWSLTVSVEGQELLREKGFSVFPYAISRYEQAPGEVWGRSPAMDVLPTVKTLNEMKKTVLTQGHRAVNPVFLTHDDGVLGAFNMLPGAVNPGGVSSEGRPLVHTLPVGRIDIGKDLMDDERAAINDAFLVNLFQILMETPQMTATEVMERTREKGILLAPTIGRQQSEYLGPLIERELDILSRLGLLPPMPQILLEAKGEYMIEYDSPLSKAQRAEEASGLMRTIESVLQIVNVTQNPEPLDYFNWDEIVPDMASIQSVPEKWINAMDRVQAIRGGRAQQAQEQQMMQAAPGAAAMIKAGAVARQAS